MSLKKQIITQITDLLNQNIELLKLDLASTIESRNSDTKSSAGDKFETGRAMMQMELEKNKIQLNKTERIKRELSNIDVNKISTKVEFGSLVYTTQGNYFLSLALGKVIIENTAYYAISLAAPIGQLLQDKKEGDSFEFQGNKISILTIE
jgi:transcription elongation GreA/GreB family factor